MASKPPPADRSGQPSSSAASVSKSGPGGASSAQATLQNIQFEDHAPKASGAAGGVPLEGQQQKKKRHRGKKRRNRRQSFAAPSETTEGPDVEQERPSLLDARKSHSGARDTFYTLGRGATSSTSLESEALLDHRDTGPLQTRRQSLQQGMFAGRGAQLYNRQPKHRPSQANPFLPESQARPRLTRSQRVSESGEIEEDDDANDRTPLISSSNRDRPGSARSGGGYGGFTGSSSGARHGERQRRQSTTSSRSSRRMRPFNERRSSSSTVEAYDINNPPSVPGSPRLHGQMAYEDVMLREDMSHSRSPDTKRIPDRDVVIDIDQPGAVSRFDSSPPTPTDSPGLHRRQTGAEDDVCFPHEGLSEIGEDDYRQRTETGPPRHHRRRPRAWPDLSVLEEWSAEEKEERTMEGIRARKISEPLLIGGRLRPTKAAWHRQDDDAPFRWTYFNEEFENTIHSQTISELLQPGQTFKDLFVPEPPELSDDSSDDEEDLQHKVATPPNGQAQTNSTRHSSTSRLSEAKPSSGDHTGQSTPAQSQTPKQKSKRYGPRPVFWLDVLSPTDAEMRAVSKAFGIHPLTAEDIMVQEAREKVELFRHYYFVNYRTFEQDTNNEEYLEPVNMYILVFREGVISFHFSMTPHPANVRRRIRQLSDYLILSSDWISYAIIDDITDAYAPLIEQIEDEVDEIDHDILMLHGSQENSDKEAKKSGKSKELEYEKKSDAGDNTTADSGGDMLRRVGECRRKVMSLYRLLGTKADVIKGFAKRCNEQWEVAPRSEIGLYLGDIQDHIVTMTGNLSHYENLLSRSHSNYLAQINIRMNERAEQTNDVLGKLTILGTLVLPMNIVTGMWGMNVLVPGQDTDSLTWFWCITAGLLAFGFTSFMIAKRVYGIV